MSFTDIILIRRFSLGVISFTFFIVFFLGFGIVWSAMTAVPDGLDFRVEAGRAPASVPVFSVADPVPISPELKRGSSLETIELSCLRDAHEYTLQTTAKQVRLRGKLCSQLALQLSDTSVVNRTNGVGATLFDLGNNRFTSDYLPLLEGTNELWVQTHTQAGKAQFVQVTISRVVESAQPK